MNDFNFSPIKVIITQDILKCAISRDHGKYNDKSFLNGKGNVIGFLGEEIMKRIRPDLIVENTKDYDFITVLGKRVEVKTKHQTVDYINPTFEASICVDSIHQKCDVYCFCRIYKTKTGEYPFGWAIGTITKQRFFELSRYLKKGEIDGNNGWKITQNCYNIRYNQLNPILVKNNID